MDKLVVLKFDGNLQHQGFRISAEVASDGQYPEISTDGSLPPNPDFLSAVQQWRDDYHALLIPTSFLLNSIETPQSM